MRSQPPNPPTPLGQDCMVQKCARMWELEGVYELRTFVWTTHFLCVAFLLRVTSNLDSSGINEAAQDLLVRKWRRLQYQTDNFVLVELLRPAFEDALVELGPTFAQGL